MQHSSYKEKIGEQSGGVILVFPGLLVKSSPSKALGFLSSQFASHLAWIEIALTYLWC